MSLQLISRNDDLSRLRAEGYFVQVQGNFLVLRDVPYVDAARTVRVGSLISSLTLAGDRTLPPDTHVVHFDGEHPCHADGRRMDEISHQTANVDLGNGLVARHSFSSKPAGGYRDYYEKMSTYATLVSAPAASLRPGATPRTFRAPDADEETVFNYLDTASARAGVTGLAGRLAACCVAIIGLGGTGSYVLDLVAKTPVRRIDLFDADELLTHNAFRAPGAPSIEELRNAPKKVDYFKNVYSAMHRAIVAHPVRLTSNNTNLLDDVSFAFICADAGDEKAAVVEALETRGASFIDAGMGLELTDGSLGGILRVTASVPDRRTHFRQRVSLAKNDGNDVYSSNIQIADLNALNATLAVIRWKKLMGFYRDLEGELHCTYTTDGNMLVNSDLP